MAITLERIATLLQVAELATKWPALNGILGLANDELIEANKEALKQLEEKRKKEAEEKAKQLAEARAAQAAEEKKAAASTAPDDDEPAHASARRI